jgi:5-methylcytosine-specific restriction protein B
MFSWKPIYSELARVLPAWRSRQSELIAILHAAREQRVPVGALQDEDNKGKKFPLQVIDPFTFFAFFNRKIRDEHRIKLLSLIKDKFGLTSPLPTDFEGLPVMNPQKSWFFSCQKDREPDAIDTLWDFAKAIVEQSPEAVDGNLFARSRAIRQVGLANLTMGLFWMRPDHYLAVDKRNRALLKSHGIEPDISDWPSYLNLLQQVKKQIPGSSWSEFSQKAYQGDTGKENPDERRYWLFQANPKLYDLVGALKAGKLQT